MSEKSKNYEQLFNHIRSSYYIPKNESVAANKDFYNAMISGSLFFTLLGKNSVHKTTKKNFFLTKQELFKLLDLYVFIKEKKILPFTKIPNKEYVNNLFNTMLPDIYIQLQANFGSEQKETKNFTHLMKIFDDPRKLNLVQFNTNQKQKKLIDKLNSSKIDISIKQKYQDHFSELIAKINGKIKQILKTDGDRQDVEASLNKLKENIIQSFNHLTIIYPQNIELKEFFNKNEHYRAILNGQLQNNNIFDIVWGPELSDDCERLYDLYTNKKRSGQSQFTIDVRNALHDSWQDPNINKSDENMLDLLSNALFGVPYNSQQTGGDVIKMIANEINCQLESFAFAISNIEWFEESIKKQLIWSLIQTFFENILIKPNTGDFDRFFIERISPEQTIIILWSYLRYSYGGGSVLLQSKNMFLLQKTQSLIQQYIILNNNVEQISLLERIICYKQNNSSIQHAIVTYVKQNLYSEIKHEELTLQDIQILFQCVICHFTGSNVGQHLQQLLQKFQKSSKCYQKLWSFNFKTDLSFLFNTPSKQAIQYYIDNNQISKYISNLEFLSNLIFQTQETEKQMYLIIIYQTICNSQKWNFLNSIDKIDYVCLQIKSYKDRLCEAILAIVKRIVEQGWTAQFKEKISKFDQLDWQIKWIIIYCDPLSLIYINNDFNSYIPRHFFEQIIAFISMGITTEQNLLNIYSILSKNLPNNEQEELKDLCKKLVYSFEEKLIDFQNEQNSDGFGSFQEEDPMDKLFNRTNRSGANQNSVQNQNDQKKEEEEKSSYQNEDRGMEVE